MFCWIMISIADVYRDYRRICADKKLYELTGTDWQAAWRETLTFDVKWAAAVLGILVVVYIVLIIVEKKRQNVD